MNLTLKIWRQENATDTGKFVEYQVKDISEDSSFLEMLDLLNEQLISENKDAVAFDHDCREGICGMCSLVINGDPHGPKKGLTVCQLHMRNFNDGDTITIEPWRAKPFPVVKDLVVDRSSFDTIIQSGGYITARSGSTQDANSILVPKDKADTAMDAAACIGCGACVAACRNGSAMLFVAAKVAHLNTLPQGQPEKDRRTLKMVQTMDELGFGNCRNYTSCEAVCPKEIPVDMIGKLNRDYAVAKAKDVLWGVK
ncbi:MAG: succinate dehydrogenase [Verrucomicrobia bacterium CG_4_10_14_3_um_filter_43_23]|nr:MAG: succinate dehydrogenase [Verrucomicrobia bacterium CG1_02_43_26]PIP59466.1 MAG: succinate dehydrogenase [Verrucomicrobia bacterium CG22_combo_CG10-13_8_21_14_all_43_17]PIX58627.1 MAG: succinate dehydrogenase [Verrucomicrobia bacterium CG_4_10_14_3_um_filter_43_23]PIY61452.1 MAG: succinate dehydrogenase [Verrucomicrobia bacterium CG_4_10_14_0_8_um_filter_43_34]PJA43819.1 MAG: succinate dehydrogenase [Verrucomicrobia bacterium CG_4_9_14_3_um_filter_43_20]